MKHISPTLTVPTQPERQVLGHVEGSETPGHSRCEAVEGIIMTGVHAWRRSPFESAMPRPLVPVANRALIEHSLAWLGDAGVSNAGICANSDTGALRRNLNKGVGPQLKIHYCEDAMPRGPAGSIRDAAIDSPYDTLIAVEGTILPYNVVIDDLLEAHARSNAAMTIVVIATDHDSVFNCGPTVPAGIYVFSQRVLEHVSESGYQDIKEALIPALNRAGESVMPYIVKGPVPRVMDADSYMAANAWMLERICRSVAVPNGYRHIGEALVHQSSSVSEKTRLIGPVLVGPGSTVAESATVIGPSAIGARCTLCPGTTLCRSVLWDDVTIHRDCVIDRCVLTMNVEAKAGTQRVNAVFAPIRSH